MEVEEGERITVAKIDDIMRLGREFDLIQMKMIIMTISRWGRR